MKTIRTAILLSMLFCLYAHGANRSIDEALEISIEKLRNSVAEVQSPDRYPCYGTEDLRWQLRGSEDWTSGFYPGCLWFGYAFSRDPNFLEWAKQWTLGIEEEKHNAETHDLGFRFMCTFGNWLRFDPPEDSGAIESIILEAAETMSHRFNPAVGALSSNWDSWDNPMSEKSFPVVIDIMMNLELLYWASEHGSPTHYAEIASQHARTTWRDFIRPDGGSYHVVRYDPETGKVLDKGQLQGDKKESTWSRGHAWAIYGFVVCYRYTGDTWFLERAEILADYFLAHLPASKAARWDFQSDNPAPDVSASAITASALFEMANLHPESDASAHYLKEAEAILLALSNAPWFADPETGTNCILDHSTQYLPINGNVDRPSIFADYYYLEALYRHKELK